MELKRQVVFCKPAEAIGRRRLTGSYCAVTVDTQAIASAAPLGVPCLVAAPLVAEVGDVGEAVFVVLQLAGITGCGPLCTGRG